METENISVDDFLPAKKTVKPKNIKRRAVSESGDGMEIEEHNGIQGKPKHRRSKAKKKKLNVEPNESKVNMRKVAVPAHRYRYNLSLKLLTYCFSFTYTLMDFFIFKQVVNYILEMLISYSKIFQSVYSTGGLIKIFCSSQTKVYFLFFISGIQVPLESGVCYT